MPIYKISRGWLHVDVIEVKAESKDQAFELAENAPEEQWKHCDSVEDINYQLEGERDE